MNQFFDTIGGLPLHPLTVHAASVLIPLSAIALVLLVFVPKWRKAYLPLTVGALAVSVVLAFDACLKNLNFTAFQTPCPTITVNPTYVFPLTELVS